MLGSSKKKLSGFDRVKKKRLIEDDNAKLSKTAKKYFVVKSIANPDGVLDVPVTASSTTSNLREDANKTITTTGKTSHSSQETDKNDMALEMLNYNELLPQTADQIDVADPSTWPLPMPSSIRNFLLSEGPKSAVLKVYPSRNGFAFNNRHFRRIEEAQVEPKEQWLIYSKTTNSLFCFVCCMFLEVSQMSTPWSNYGLKNEGFCDFRHTSRGVKAHEESQSHFLSFLKWKAFEKNSKKDALIDSKVKANYNKEVKFWQEVLSAILDAILFLAKNNLAFQGTSRNINDKNCGNFLSLISLLSKYHPPLALHISRLSKGKVSYLSSKIQNEFISIAGGAVRKNIIQNIIERKYYSIMFDGTPDTSHKEQISQIIRTVKVAEDGCSIEENFIDFIHCDDKTGLQLSQVILAKLEADGLSINNCRAQGYDNGSNMAGQYQGVQSRIREHNPLAVFIPCAAHSLNLVGQNAATKIMDAKLVLGQIQNVFNFFSSSPNRWTILKRYVSETPKNPSSTRWSSKAEAVKIISQEFENICECLVFMINSESLNAQTVADACSRYNDICNFKFLLGITVWDWILSRIQVCNLALQSRSIDVEEASKHLFGLLTWLRNFREDGYASCVDKAKEKAECSGIDLNSGFEFRRSRNMKAHRFRDSEQCDTESNMEKFRRKFFLALIDQLILEFEKRFKALKDASTMFGFLWGNKLGTLTEKQLTEHVMNLSANYKDDFESSRFCREIVFLKSAVESFIQPEITIEKLALDILNILTQNHLSGQFINCHTALRIFLTLPVSVATNERAFSKLKLIKNFHRSSMSQERLSNLGILSIEHEHAETMSFDTIIREFASVKCRKVMFLH